jgi:DNA-binding NarL/FixJ family response regulator
VYRTNLPDGMRPMPEANPKDGAEAPWRLLILSDIRFLREALADVLARDGIFAVCGTAADLEEALALSRVVLPQLTLIDAAFPDGLGAARSLTELGPQNPVVALALTETESDVIAWAEAGASGYVPRTAALNELVGYLHSIVRGEQACSTRIAGGLLRWISSASRGSNRRSSQPKLPTLTAREGQIAELVSNGLSNKEIARRLNIGLATTKSHVHNLLSKLELQRRGEVARWSRDNALSFLGSHPFRSQKPVDRGEASP